jgi:7 transmembrane helices usually fused to an inactive transglutaminase
MSSEPMKGGGAIVHRVQTLGLTLVVAAFAVIVWALLDRSDTALTRAVTAALGDPARPWQLPGLYLLLVLPFGAVVVVFVRSILGWQTFGLFTPMLLALSYLQSGPVLGPTISTGAILIGMLTVPVLKRLELSRVAFLGALISIVVAALGALAVNLEQMVLISAFPVVVTALIVERWWNAWETEGPRKAIRVTGTTLLVAMVIQFIVAMPAMRYVVATAPLAICIGSVFVMIVLGRYKGLRLSEYSRFRAARRK